MRLLQLSLKPAQGSPGQELGLPEASRGWAVPSRRPRDPNPRRLPAPSHSRDSLSKTRVRGVLLSTWVAAEPSSFRRDRDMFPEPLGGRSSPGSEEDSLRGIRIDSFKDPPPPPGEGTRDLVEAVPRQPHMGSRASTGSTEAQGRQSGFRSGC